MKLNRIAALATAVLFPLATLAQTPAATSLPTPTLPAQSSFKAFAASFSPSGEAALHLLQTFLNCPNNTVAQSIDSTLVSTVVLYETMGKYRPTPAESRTLPKEEFRRRVLLGITQIQGVDNTDVATTVDCHAPQSQVETWKGKLETKSEGFIQFKQRLESVPH